MDIGALDIIILVIIAASAVWGIFKGFVRQIVSIAALLLGVWCAFKFTAYLSAQAKDWDGNPLLPDKIPCLRTPEGKQVPEWTAFAEYLKQGKCNPAEGYDSIENDDFVPLGYTLLAVLFCAVAVCRISRRRN